MKRKKERNEKEKKTPKNKRESAGELTKLLHPVV
jgi:hypothetical protein